MLAVQHLYSDVRSTVMPLVDIAAPTKKDDKAAAITYVERNIKRAAKALNGIPSAFVDSSELEPAFRLTGDKHPLVEAARALRQAGIRPVPVTGIHRDASHRAATLEVAGFAEVPEICFRLDGTDVSTSTLTFNRLQAQMESFEVESPQVYLLIDLQCLYGQEADDVAPQLHRFLKLVNSKSWAGILIGGYGLPDQLSTAVSTKGESYLDRVEQHVFYQALQLDLDSPAWFADYTTLPPSAVELDWKIMVKVMGPKVLYALEDSWFIARGGAFSSHPDHYDQYFSLAKKIADLDDCCGEEHCYGDAYIWERAGGFGKPGNPGSWITACVNHHITLTAHNHA
jgi:hypothetical protein